MTPEPAYLIDVTKAIQLALAPVFLLTGIAGMLNVMTGRLARIIDRGRTLTENKHAVIIPEKHLLIAELQILDKRRHLTSVAITACTISALLLCMVIVTLFVEIILSAPLQWLIGTLFATSILALVVGLAYFLWEVHLAMKTIHITMPT
jgi:hypothetical protein